MTTLPTDKSEQQVCVIMVTFPISSDEEAIQVKKDIEATLSEVEKVRTEFRITSMPVR